jgi:transcriptional regulator with XRE-family HTH domain
MNGHIIKALRESRGLTTTALGELIGVSQSAVSNWETIEGRGPSREVLPRLAAALGVSIDALFSETTNDDDACSSHV